MKSRSLAVLCWLSLVLAGASRAVAAPVPLPALPSLGTVLRALPDSTTYSMVDDRTVAPSFEALVGSSIYTIAVDDKKNRVIFISTKSPNFTTPDGFTMDSTVGEVMAKYPKGLVEEKDFGSYVKLPSGWCAQVLGGGTLNPKAKVMFFFVREKRR